MRAGAGETQHLPDVRKSSKASSYFLSNFLAIIVLRAALALPCGRASQAGRREEVTAAGIPAYHGAQLVLPRGTKDDDGRGEENATPSTKHQ